MRQLYVKIEGIHCEHCRDKIKKELIKNKKIKQVEIDKNIASISYSGKLENKEIIKLITNIDYFTKEEYISEDLQKIDTSIKFKEFIMILVCIICIVIAIKLIFGYNIFNMIPSIDASITYGMLVITGIFTSIHCMSMCGGIYLLTILNHSENRNIKRSVLYNLGRVISYTTIGGIAGLIGSALSINDTITGIFILFASFVMLGMSLNMLGIIKFKFPNFISGKVKKKTNNAFLIGVLNGLMPCGPLQAMQIYALSTGSFFKGALSMFLFAIGTVPLMLFIGIVIHLTKGKKKILINKIASVFILLLSIVMLNRGLLTLNVDISKIFQNSDYVVSTIYDDYQKIEFNLSYDDYEDIILQKDIPVKMIIHVDKQYLTGCNNEVIIKDFKVKQKLKIGENIIEFIPTKTGTYTYTCFMNMIKNNIKVIDNKNYFMEEKNE